MSAADQLTQDRVIRVLLHLAPAGYATVRRARQTKPICQAVHACRVG